MPRVREPADSARRRRIQTTLWALAYLVAAMVAVGYGALALVSPTASALEKTLVAIVAGLVALLCCAGCYFDLRSVWRKPGGGQ